MKRQENNQFLGHDEKIVFLALFAWERNETEPYTLEGIIQAPRSNLASRMHVVIGMIYFDK